MMADRICVVTGASSGIGRAVAVRLARHGAKVVVAGRRADRLTALVVELAGQGRRVVPFIGDMLQPSWTEELLAVAERQWGPADLAVLSAGRGLPGTVLTSDPMQWAEVIETNYTAVLRQLRTCATEFIKQAIEQDGDRVRDLVVIGSTAGRQISAANSVYGSTKFALHSLVESLRQEVCMYKIRVTLIEPGFVRSGFQAAAGYDPKWFDGIDDNNGPLLLPEDVAEVIDFVVSRPPHVHVDDIRLRPTRQIS